MRLTLALLLVFPPLLWPQSTPGFRFHSSGAAAPVPEFARVSSGGGTDSTSDRTVTVTTAVSGSLLVAFVNVQANANTTPTMSDDHADSLGAWTRIHVRGWNTNAHTGSAFVRNALLGSTDTSFTITAATGSNSAGEIVVVEVTGMQRAGSAAIRSWNATGMSNQTSGSTPAPVFNNGGVHAALTSNVTMSAVYSAATIGASAVPNADWTERADVGQASPNTCVEVATRDSGFTGDTITYGGTVSTVYSSIAVELDGSAP